MRKTIILILVAVIAMAPMPSFAGEAEGDEKVRTRRVIRVTAGDETDVFEDHDLVFLGENGEPFHAGPHLLQRGGYLGVQLVDITPELRGHFGVPEDAGVMISAVSDDGPAAAAGVEVGDIVGAVDGKSVASGGELARIVRQGSEGDNVNLEVWRDGKLMTLQATLAERERKRIDIAPMFLWKGGKTGRLEKLEELEALARLEEFEKLEELEGLSELETIIEPEELRALEMRLENLPVNVIRINQKHLEKALGELNEHLESPEWKDRMRSMIEERQEMEVRIHELEARLRELEQRLSRLATD